MDHRPDNEAEPENRRKNSRRVKGIVTARARDTHKDGAKQDRSRCDSCFGEDFTESER